MTDDERQRFSRRLREKDAEIERLSGLLSEMRTTEAMAVLQDEKMAMAHEIGRLRTVLKMGVQLCESGGHGKGEQCPTCHFMREAQAALANKKGRP